MKNLLLLIGILISLPTIAQDYVVDLNYYLPKDVTYNSAIPTPSTVIGHEVGEWHITHDKLVQYMYALAEASDRITIENRGATFEGRPILLLTITSPVNQRNIDDIKAQHLALTESGSSTLNTANMPAVVYQGFSIHGNEPSGSNAGLAVAYYLAAAQGSKIDELLTNTVILFDPSFNPDGLQRFAYWANMHKAKNINPDPNDREYREVWPGGRTNHYWFDVNRDWLPVQLPESRARIKTFHDWYPNILTDHHEMGRNSSFFFQPGIPSRTHPLTPQKNQDLTKEIAKYHARAFDQLGSFYFSEENFDDFYYGKGSTFPDINGGVGILFEQASSRGHAQESSNGVLTFPFTIRNQFTAALSTLEAAVALRRDLLDYQRDFFDNARIEGASGGAIVFGDEKDAAKAFHLAEILKRHKIAVHELKEDFSSNGKNYKNGYSYVVLKKQRQHRLIKAIFEKRTQFQDSLFYDISAWSFPLAFNLDYIENAPVSRAGKEIIDLQMKTPDTPNVSTYAYLMEWHEYYSPKALNMVLSEGLRAKVAMKPFSLEGRDYDYGTILIPLQNQKLQMADLTKFLAKVSRETKVPIHGVRTGLANGIDLGSNQFRPVELPKVAMLVGDGINPYDAGEIWHLFDTRFDMKITKLDTRNFGRTDLSRYTDIIMPASWGNALDKQDAEKLKKWVQDGGSLIAFRNAGRFLDRNEMMKIKFKSRKDTATNVSYEQRGKYRGAQVVGGAIFEAKLDRSHPIAFGYKNDRLAMFRNTTLFVEPDADSYNNPIQYTSNPLLSGYISKPNLKDLASTVPFKTSGVGRGQVLYFTDNTNFRAFWYGTNKLLMNAIFFGDKM
ncbi:MAG: zinc carboxypeptidase [Bacteroidia bacterium]|nr:zinc carboxypeptidase [Bacteroidia bacterium]NNF31894.1 zinc carboxypeptidase [Flavobacteriaceae bacterium]MBT8277009.1 zinc carboxypeptidase [Bacteroidia bacterium]NNJ82211.1 zinc carboxypeptidase [Flavobacteriaceae bacterium]NNK53582.1 zinc carboxypeptidase [Flavobacteriaceae bacterium]